MSETPETPLTYDSHPYKVAFIDPDTYEVADTLRLHERMGAILLSDPIIVDISGNDDVQLGDIYNPEDGSFSHE